MKSIGIGILLGLFCQFIGSTAAQGQISHVTVRTLKSPGPPMALVQSNAPPAAAAVASPAPVHVRRIVRPSVDKAELERRVVAFQQQRAVEGFPSAQYQLGLRLLEGNGVERNVAAGRKWLAAAAEAGHSQARKKIEELKAKE
jgi:hypothetical protein